MKLIKANMEKLNELVIMNIQLRMDEKMDNVMSETEVSKRMQLFLETTDYCVLIIKKDDETVGYCVINVQSKPIYLRQLFIKEIYRNKGFGKKSINEIMKMFSINDIDIEVMIWNEGAIRFYETNGFRKRYIGMRYSK